MVSAAVLYINNMCIVFNSIHMNYFVLCLGNKNTHVTFNMYGVLMEKIETMSHVC